MTKGLYVANVGDSRAVLARGIKGGELKAEDLTRDHKPDCEAETQRIIDSGKGQVRRLEGDIPKRVFLKDTSKPKQDKLLWVHTVYPALSETSWFSFLMDRGRTATSSMAPTSR